MSVSGLITVESSHGPEETMGRLVAGIEAKGLTVFKHIDQMPANVVGEAIVAA